GRPHCLALRTGRAGTVRRPAADPRRRARAGAPAAPGGCVHAGRLGHRAALPAAHAVARRRQDLARGVVRGRAVPRLRRAAGVRGVPARRRCAADVRGDQDRHVRPAAAGVLHGCAPDVPVLRRQRGGRLQAVAADVAAGGVLAADARAPGAGAGARLPVAVDRGRAAAGAFGLLAVAQLPARTGAGAAAGAVPRLCMASDRAGAVHRAEPDLRLRRRLHPRPRAGACAVHRLLRQPAGGDGDAGDAGPFRAAAGVRRGGDVRVRGDPGGERDARRRRTGARPDGLACGGRCWLAAGVRAMGAAFAADLPGAARRRKAGLSNSATRHLQAGTCPAAGRMTERPSIQLTSQATQAHEPKATGPMIEFYPQIKMAHIFLALCSGAIFALRGAGVLANMRWPHWAAIRWTSYTVDTSLLTAALMLVSILPCALLANGWLAATLVLLVVHIVLRVLA